MRHLLTCISIVLCSVCLGQTYYEPQASDSVQSTQGMTRKEKRKTMKMAHDEHPKCYCPYQQSTTVWHDVWNSGIVGTVKAVYQSTVKPQVIGEAVGTLQKAGQDSPLPTIAASTATTLAISEVQKSRRHQRNKQVPQAGRACDCDPCPYHGQRYHSNTKTH